MGKKGREIVQKKTNVQEIVDSLQRAYADEWQAHYNYLLAANLATGLHADMIASKLRAQSVSELDHANRICTRLLQLGAEPVRTLRELADGGNCSAFLLPENSADIRGIVKAVLDFERCAIDVYVHLVEQTRHVDPVTHELAEALLADEVQDEDEFEALLAE